MRSTLLATLAIAAAAPLAAQGSMATMPGMTQQPTTGYRAEVIKQMATVSDHMVQLANAIPQEKFTWRPGPGVRSVAEVFLHITQAQYLFGAPIGVKPPAGMDMKTFETSTTDKTQIIAAMKAAFAAMSAAIAAMPDANLENPVKLFGMTMTTRGLLLMETDHNAEHYGQMIAYSRVNGVVPPWSMQAGN